MKTCRAARNPLTKVEVIAIADFLANMGDLMVEDLGSEFRSTMLASFPNLEAAFLDYIYATFMAIDPTRRFDIHFNHLQFVGTAFRSYSDRR